jgi:thioredoxin-like negative regulator of GroEL
MINKIAYWTIWTAFTIVVAVFAYRHSGWFSPATEKTNDTVKPLLGKVLTEPTGKHSPLEKIASAREAFAQGNMDRAISDYNDFIKKNTRNADVRGELGNVYYLTGRPEEAAEAYYDAAQLLLKEHDFERVAAVIPIIAETKPMMADELSQKLRTAMGEQRAVPTSGMHSQRAPQSALTRY